MAEGNSIFEKTIKNFQVAYEITVRNTLPNILKVFRIYNIYDDRVHRRHLDKGGEYKFHNPALEEKAFRLTERYFDIQKIKELKKISAN